MDFDFVLVARQLVFFEMFRSFLPSAGSACTLLLNAFVLFFVRARLVPEGF